MPQEQNRADAIKLIATCPEEAKGPLVEELMQLGATSIVTDFMAVHFTATQELYYEVHLKLRTASSLLRVIRVIRTPTEETMYSQSCRIAWPALFDSNKSFRVDGIDADRSGRGMFANVISKKIKEGILHSFHRKKQKLPQIALKNPDLIVIGYNQQYKCTLSIDTTGQSLHKRGYRTANAHPAPLKETLAAAILLQVGYRGQKPLVDAMCGSGTIAIEAAMIALHKAPLIHRSKGVFAFEHLKDFNNTAWRAVQDRVRHTKKDRLDFPIIASDIEEKYVELARANAKKARVEKYIEFSVRSFTQIKPDGEVGIVIANLPYGDRLKTNESLQGLYKKIGDWLKQNFSGWEAVLITSTASPWRFIGLHPRKKYKFYNGKIEILALVFDLYAGSRKRIRGKETD